MNDFIVNHSENEKGYKINEKTYYGGDGSEYTTVYKKHNWNIPNSNTISLLETFPSAGANNGIHYDNYHVWTEP